MTSISLPAFVRASLFGRYQLTHPRHGFFSRYSIGPRDLHVVWAATLEEGNHNFVRISFLRHPLKGNRLAEEHSLDRRLAVALAPYRIPDSGLGRTRNCFERNLAQGAPVETKGRETYDMRVGAVLS